MQLNATIIGQSISFILFVIFCMKYIWPNITSAIEKRQKKIEKGLQFAEQAKQDLEIAHNNAIKYIDNAKKKSEEIIKEAYVNKQKIIDQAKLEAKIERKKIISQALLEIDIKKHTVYKNIYNDIVKSIITTTEKILEKNIDFNTNNILIKKIISNIYKGK